MTATPKEQIPKVSIGMPWIWVILNSVYVLVYPRLIYQRLLKTEKWRWYLHDVISPTAGALGVATVFWLTQPNF